MVACNARRWRHPKTGRIMLALKIPESTNKRGYAERKIIKCKEADAAPIKSLKASQMLCIVPAISPGNYYSANGANHFTIYAQRI